jgi:hypothetical protein
MILATVAIGLALLVMQQAHHELKKMAESFTELNHATNIFPHPNEKTKSFQKRKQ